MTRIHIVTVNPQGEFEPKRLVVGAGETVEWRLAHPRDAILPVDFDRVSRRPTPRGFDPEDVNEFTGPLVRAVPGVHCINQPRQPEGETLPDWVWDEPGFNAVYIRLDWQIVNPAPGIFDWTSLTPHMEAAARSGKFFGTSIRAGVQETPSWLFEDNLYHRQCQPVRFQGIARTLGLPQDPSYQHWWFELHRALASHIRSNNAWWQRFVSIRVSGANYHSAEARLPNREVGEDGPGVPARPDWEVWEEAGYTPEGLYAFYAAQGDLFQELFPGKDICYPLIQDGFPRANAADPGNRPTGTEQTVRVINQGRERWGSTWIVQHLGLQALREPPNGLPYSESHPVTSARGVTVGDGNPNQWALRAGIDGSPTAGQTVNSLHETSDGLERALRNAWSNSDYLWVEVYAKEVEPSYRAGSGPIGESGYTLAQWSDRFARWRSERWDDELGPACPDTHRHTFVRTLPGEQVFHYLNPRSGRHGAVILRAP